MSSISRQQLQRNLASGRIDPLYLLFGPEDYLRDAAADSIADAALKDAALRDFNDTSFSLASSDLHHAIAGAEQLPMMGARRVVRLTDFTKLKEDDEAALMRYLSRPVETSVVVFIADELDKRRKLTKTLLTACTSVEFAQLRDADLRSWAKEHLRSLGASVEDATLRHLVLQTGPSVRQLALELDKLATAALPSGRITFELVDALVGRSRELSNFELTDRLIARDRKRALETLNRLLEDGAEPPMLIGLLASSFHKLALAKAMMARGEHADDVFKVVSMPYSQRQEFLATARRANADELWRRIRRIAEADLAIKTSRATPRLQIEMLVCELSSD